MEPQRGARVSELSAILIAPDRGLAEQFTETLHHSRAFQILVDLKAYPSGHALGIKLRQVRPDVVLLDVASNQQAATELLRYLAALDPPVHVVGLSQENDPDLLLKTLRLGASEFLHAPFDVGSQSEAVLQLLRLRQPDPVSSAQPGIVTVFSSTKPGSGASTLAIQTAFALRRLTGSRVLLADCDLLGGTVGFYSSLGRPEGLLDALRSADSLTFSLWSSFVSDLGGLDVLAGPDGPYTAAIDSPSLNAVLEFARMHYDWIFIDLPVVFQRWSLMVLSNSDQALLVSTSELASLHLARKAVRLLGQLGFPKDRFQMLLNRVNRREEIGRASIEELLEHSIYSELPNDYFSLNKVATLGQPIDAGSELGKAVDRLASRLCGVSAQKPKMTETGQSLRT